jgi:hypothetical protein
VLTNPTHQAARLKKEQSYTSTPPLGFSLPVIKRTLSYLTLLQKKYGVNRTKTEPRIPFAKIIAVNSVNLIKPINIVFNVKTCQSLPGCPLGQILNTSSCTNQRTPDSAATCWPARINCRRQCVGRIKLTKTMMLKSSVPRSKHTLSRL